MRRGATGLVQAGWIVNSADTNVGILTASKSIQADDWRQVVLGERQHNIQTTIIFTQISPGRVAVKVAMNYATLGKIGQPMGAEEIESVEFYERHLGPFYTQLSLPMR